ncbi:hypothetical protein MNV49_002666 [Pseudohyphozyma bogoriensis]|nr:hypothetical protein MNV49_002666 [Pseudohyphozyma bogoriensis]
MSPPAIPSKSYHFTYKATPNTYNGGPGALVFLPSDYLAAAPPSDAAPVTAGYPVAIYIHGGAFIVGGCSDVVNNPHHLDWLLRAGIVVVSVEYRKGPHVGVPEMCEDVSDGVEWVRGGALEKALAGVGKEVKIDRRRIGVWGHSAGGHLTAFVGTLTPPVNAVMPFFGPVNWPFTNPIEAPNFPPEGSELWHLREAVLKFPVVTDATKRPGEFSPMRKPIDPPITPDGSSKEEREARFPMAINAMVSKSVQFISGNRGPSNDPYVLATSAYPPTFLLHGSQDDVVPVGSSISFHEKLKELGVEAHLEIMEGAGHGWKVVEGAEGPEGERYGIEKRAFEWFVEKIKA